MDNYTLTLYDNEGNIAKLDYKTMQEAFHMSRMFMLTGKYYNTVISTNQKETE